MEAPDAKRPRLDHEPAHYPPSHPLRPASTPVLPAPQHSHADHPLPTTAVNTYSAPPTGAGASVHHPHPAPAGQPLRENGTELHRANTHPATTHSPHPDHAPGYGVVAAHHQPLPYPGASQPSSAPPHPAGYDSRRPSSADRHPVSMAEHQQHHGLPQHPSGPHYPPQIDPHVNGTIPPNGMAYHHQEQYAVGHPVAHHAGYPSTPSTAYHAPPPMYPQQGPSQYVSQPRRKQVRATQACNHCRARKQKCDEQRPCGYCASEGLGESCQYKDVPPPKTDRHISQLLEQQNSIVESLNEMRQAMNQLAARTGNADAGSIKLMSPPEFGTGELARYNSTGGDVNGEDSKRIEPEFNVPERDQAPASHETGAQYLVRWPFIDEYFGTAGVSSAEYVLEDTEKSGTLRPYGSTEVENGVLKDAPFDDEWEDDTTEQAIKDPLEDLWGSGPPRRSYNNPPNIGGGNPDGSLDLVQDTVWRLYDSYMRNMWILHPILDARWLSAKVEEFVGLHSPAADPIQSDGQFAMPGMPASGGRPDTPGSTTGKRKRQSNASEDTVDMVASDNARRWQAPRKTPDRSMQNAIILLVLALGKVLLEERFLLEEFSTRTISAESSEVSYANSPYDASRPSPRSHGAYDHAASPGDIKTTTMARGASYEGHRAKRPRKNGKYPNAELFPGLAYFAYASDILGNNLGGNGIMHAQAFLLAGIYYGQLGRVTESWSWINEGLRVTTILTNKKKYRETLLSRIDEDPSAPPRPPEIDPKSNLIATLCWSALQLESDLRAELDQLPQPSQLMYAEAKIIVPPQLSGVEPNKPIRLYQEPSLDAAQVLHSYHYQIMYRLNLNRTHTALYSTKSRIPHNRNKRTTVAWTDADTGVLFENLQNIRKFLGKLTKFWWADSQTLADNLLEARLRAKYYGGEYIILRPYVYNALRWEKDGGTTPRPPFDLLQWVTKHNDEEKQATSRRVWAKEHNQDYDFGNRKLPEVEISYDSFQKDASLAEQFLWCCKRCIDAAMASTSAFDGVANPHEDKRLRVTNIHGTATAQFSNMLVLCAVFRSWLSVMVDKDRLKTLMDRTIALHDRLAPLAPIFRTNRKVLQAAYNDIFGSEATQIRQIPWGASPSSLQGSHPSMSPASAGTPRVPYGAPPTSATGSFGSTGRY